MVLSFILLIWCITLMEFFMLNQHCIPGINPTLSWQIILSLCCWIWFTSILLRISASILIRDIALSFSFLVMSLSGLGQGNNIGLTHRMN